MRTALTIAGSDSSGGAGIQADLRTFAAFGVYGASAITAVTAQNTSGITASQAMPADLVTAQIEAVAGDLAIDAVKTGMLATAAIVEAVAAAIEELELPKVVVDPVLFSTGGVRLLEDDGVETLRAELLPRSFMVTPNLPEARALGGVSDAREAARRIRELGVTWVVITGGHAEDDDAVDLAFDGRTFTELRGERIVTPGVHGTGCAFASAVAACLALGQPPLRALSSAKAFVADGIRRASAVGKGARVIGVGRPQTDLLS